MRALTGLGHKIALVFPLPSQAQFYINHCAITSDHKMIIDKSIVSLHNGQLA
jgi:hypothetical protein